MDSAANMKIQLSYFKLDIFLNLQKYKMPHFLCLFENGYLHKNINVTNMMDFLSLFLS